MGRDAADGAVSVAGGLQVHRHRAGEDQSAQVDGLVVISIVKHNVAGSEDGVGDDLIGCGGAIQDEIGFVGVKYFRRVLLRRQRRPFVNEKIPQVGVRAAKVRAEHIGTVEIIERFPCRMFLEERTALVPRRVELVIVPRHVLGEGVEERRQQVSLVLRRAAENFFLPRRLLFDGQGNTGNLRHIFRGGEAGFQKEKRNPEGVNGVVGGGDAILAGHHHRGYLRQVCAVQAGELGGVNGKSQIHHPIGDGNFQWFQKSPSFVG